MSAARVIIKDILSSIIVFSVLFSLHTLLSPRAEAMFSLLLAILFFSLLIIRRKVHNLAMFIVLHVCTALAAILVVDSVFAEPTVSASVRVFTVVSLAYSFYARANREWDPRVPTVIGILALNLILLRLASYDYVHYPTERDLVFALSSLFAFSAAILYRHIDNVDVRLNMLNDVGKRSSNTILRTNNKLIVVFILSVTTFGLFSLFLPADTIGNAIMNALRLLGRVNHILFPQAFENIHPIAIFGEADPSPPAYIFEQPPSEPGLAIWRLLGSLVNYLALILLLSAVTLFFSRGFHRGFYAKHKTDAEFDSDISEADEVTAARISESGDAFDIIPRIRNFIKHPVRRAYIRKVRWYIKYGKQHGMRISNCDTPNGIANKIRPFENIDNLTEAYEKVRYGKSTNK